MGAGIYILGRGFRMVDLHMRTEGAISLSQIPAGLDLPHTYAGGGRYIPVPKSRWVKGLYGLHWLQALGCFDGDAADCCSA